MASWKITILDNRSYIFNFVVVFCFHCHVFVFTGRCRLHTFTFSNKSLNTSHSSPKKNGCFSWHPLTSVACRTRAARITASHRPLGDSLLKRRWIWKINSGGEFFFLVDVEVVDQVVFEYLYIYICRDQFKYVRMYFLLYIYYIILYYYMLYFLENIFINFWYECIWYFPGPSSQGAKWIVVKQLFRVQAPPFSIDNIEVDTYMHIKS